MIINDKGTALITGASSGLGAIYADRLARDGYDLILVARSTAKLEKLAESLSTATARHVRTISADLTRAKDLEWVEEAMLSDTSVRMLVNNAGAGSTAHLQDLDVASIERMIELNVTALTRLARAAAIAFVDRGGGTIVNMGSILAVAPEVLSGGVYSGTKAYVLAFSQSLRHEFGDKGIRVQVVLPGATATDFWELSGTPVQALPANIVMTAEDAVDAALSGLAQGEFATFPSLPDINEWNAMEAARRALLPGLSRTTPAPRYATGN
ncbi:SDR family NAD(P)-dependent oxidoreductase [Lysobacter sp. TAF61]|uniref:SDR family NAD(P)-dependent oxidoreductase n=1 Tax=unclassified Lysobacter TaxID=2635362 RepID=UPI001F537A47|nr:SDR family oxidoreductase [Lysobacter sp. S4-A87]UNK49884.1 SDR family oxidoreductase [Lysobacter sp. S4-A87]